MFVRIKKKKKKSKGLEKESEKKRKKNTQKQNFKTVTAKIELNFFPVQKKTVQNLSFSQEYSLYLEHIVYFSFPR